VVDDDHVIIATHDRVQFQYGDIVTFSGVLRTYIPCKTNMSQHSQYTRPTSVVYTIFYKQYIYIYIYIDRDDGKRPVIFISSTYIYIYIYARNKVVLISAIATRGVSSCTPVGRIRTKFVRRTNDKLPGQSYPAGRPS